MSTINIMSASKYSVRGVASARDTPCDILGIANSISREMSAALRLHLPHSRAFTFTSSPSTRRDFRRSSVRPMSLSRYLITIASARPPFNPLGWRCAHTRLGACTCIYQGG